MILASASPSSILLALAAAAAYAVPAAAAARLSIQAAQRILLAAWLLHGLVLASGLLWNAERPVTGAIVVMAALLVWRHKENIIRLMQGKESRLGSKGKDKGAPAVAAVKAPHKKHKRH